MTVIEVIDDIAHIFARTTPAGFSYSSVAFNSGIANSIVAAQREAAEEHLAAARTALEEDGLLHVETVVLAGIPGDAIVSYAKQEGVDVVLMGTHGRSGLSRTVLGSVADYVLRHLDGIPVLLARAREEE